MYDATTIAASGLRANSAWFAVTASNIADSWNTPNDGLAAQMVDENEASLGFRANLASLRASNDMMGVLLDIMA